MPRTLIIDRLRSADAMLVNRNKNVEIMCSAPPYLHVVGAVIKVVLKTPSILEGMQCQARLGGNHKHYLSYGGGVSATYAVKDWCYVVKVSIFAMNKFFSIFLSHFE